MATISRSNGWWSRNPCYWMLWPPHVVETPENPGGRNCHIMSFIRFRASVLHHSLQTLWPPQAIKTSWVQQHNWWTFWLIRADRTLMRVTNPCWWTLWCLTLHWFQLRVPMRSILDSTETTHATPGHMAVRVLIFISQSIETCFSCAVSPHRLLLSPSH